MVNERRVYDVIATSTSSNHRSWAAVVKSDLLKSQSQYVIFFRPSVNQNLTPHYLDPSFIFLFVSYPCEAGLGKLGLRNYERKQGPWSPWRAKIGLTGLKETYKRKEGEKEELFKLSPLEQKSGSFWEKCSKNTYHWISIVIFICTQNYSKLCL